jgi:hypothetical protein
MNTPQDPNPLEESAGAVVGRIVFAFSRFEFDLGLCLRSVASTGNSELLNPLVDRLTFKSKLDALIEVVELRFTETPECVVAFKSWHKTMDRLRSKRNSFVHGRWGVLDHLGEVVNVSPGMPTSESRPETRFTLLELAAELSDIEQAISAFGQLRKQWHI